MRTYEEIETDVGRALSINDAEALLRGAEELEAVGSQKALAQAHNARGTALRLHGSYEEALKHYQRALEVYRELGNRDSMATITGNIGSVYSDKRSYPEALEHYHRALEVHEEEGNRTGAVGVIFNIGNVHLNTGSFTEALEYYHRALEIYTELGNRLGVANVTGNTAEVLEVTGDYPGALEHYYRALEMYHDLGDREGVARVTGNIGIVHTYTGNYPEALEHYHRALEVHTELGDRLGVANVTSNIGNVYGLTGSYPEALEHLHRALEVHTELGNRVGVANTTGSIGAVHSKTENYSEALEHDHRALEMLTALDDRVGVAIITGAIIYVLVKMERFPEAEELLVKLDTMQISSPVTAVDLELQRASLHEHHGRLEAAEAALNAARRIAEQHALAENQAEVHQRLRDLAQRSNDFPAYIEHNNEYVRITEEIRGKEATQKMAMMEAERRMEGELRERDKERALLYGTLPKEVAERLIRGEVINDQFETASVLFADIVGFTTHSSSMHPAEVTSFLEEVYRRFDAICEEHSVVKVKTIGDSYLCFAHSGNGSRISDIGAEEAASNEQRAASAAERMAAVALAMQQAEFYWPTSDEQRATSNRLQLRIGLHSGPVSAGVIGTQRMQYDIWGDTVNVASRMESTGEPGRVQVSAEFHEQLSNRVAPSHSLERGASEGGGVRFWTTERGTIEIKGKGPMTTYWLEGA